jgi:3-isopropylmalate/(R)-2-methylmalate dehydratase small subunit
VQNLRGRVALILEEDDFDVDQIVGISNIKLSDPTALADLALDWCDKEFAEKRRTGDLIVGGRNFGYGHPHYPPMIAMRHLGIAAVLAEYFSPGYWRGEIARGFPQVSCPGVQQFVHRWDELEIEWTTGVVRNLTQDTELAFEKPTATEMATLEAGGLLAYLRNARLSA